MTTWEKETTECFNLINSQIERKQDREKAMLTILKQYCIANQIIPAALIDYEEYRDWYTQTYPTSHDNMMTINEWNAFQQDIDDNAEE